MSTDVLDIAYLESGDPTGDPVVLLHGFPYDVHSHDEVAAALAEAGSRVVVPYLRGYGPTRYRSPDTIRSGQQAALGRDLLDLLDALDVDRAVVGGFDWGGRAACVLAALHPERVRALVTADGYVAYEDDERRLAEAPDITVPTVAIVPEADGIPAPDAEADRVHFTAGYEVVRLPGIGHDVPQEAPAEFAAVVLSLLARTS